MPILFLRLVAVLLTSCLLADPYLAAAVFQSQSLAGPIVIAPFNRFYPFNEEALSAIALGEHKPLSKTPGSLTFLKIARTPGAGTMARIGLQSAALDFVKALFWDGRALFSYGSKKYFPLTIFGSTEGKEPHRQHLRISPPRVGSTDGHIDGGILDAYHNLNLKRWSVDEAADYIVKRFEGATEPEYVTRLQTAIDILRGSSQPTFHRIAKILAPYLKKNSDHSDLPTLVRRAVRKKADAPSSVSALQNVHGDTLKSIRWLASAPFEEVVQALDLKRETAAYRFVEIARTASGAAIDSGLELRQFVESIAGPAIADTGWQFIRQRFNLSYETPKTAVDNETALLHELSSAAKKLLWELRVRRIEAPGFSAKAIIKILPLVDKQTVEDALNELKERQLVVTLFCTSCTYFCVSVKGYRLIDAMSVLKEPQTRPFSSTSSAA